MSKFVKYPQIKVNPKLKDYKPLFKPMGHLMLLADIIDDSNAILTVSDLTKELFTTLSADQKSFTSGVVVMKNQEVEDAYIEMSEQFIPYQTRVMVRKCDVSQFVKDELGNTLILVDIDNVAAIIPMDLPYEFDKTSKLTSNE